MHSAHHTRTSRGSKSDDPTFKSKSRSTWEVVKRVAVYLTPYKAMAAGTFCCAILSLTFSLAYPKLTQFVIDKVIHDRHYELLTPLMLGLISAFLLRDLFNSLRILINNTFEQNVIFDMRCEVFAKLQRLPVGYFDQRASGDLMTRVVEDVNSVERVLIDGTEQGSVAVLQIVAVLTIMFCTNPLLTGVALVPLPILAAGAWWYTSTAHRRYRKQREAASAMNALLMDNLQGVRQIKTFGREPHEDGRFSDRADALRAGTLGIMRVWAAYSPAMSFAGALGLALVLWVGGRQALAGVITIGQLIGFLFYLALFYEPVGKLHGLNQMLQAARAAGERVFDILDATDEPANHRKSAIETKDLPEKVAGDVRYERVSFQYSEHQPILKNVSLHARPGEMVALVGPTGAGKSTVVNLLPAFYEPVSGRITIDGFDTAKASLASLRHHISVVSQEAFLFNGTIRENILYGRLDATEEELISASRAANCHDFISRLPEGYDSRVGERGVKLSVGEKQRVSIARALLKNAPILILDEATASVDTATERLIQEALERLMENRTSFVIAHRLSTIRRASQILVMREGEIVERGTHEELLASGGLYSRLARIQNSISIEESFEKLEEAVES
jgi:ABC-type multidrug transport system fused ATPase/permease subunit